jgi:hypothetical protein
MKLLMSYSSKNSTLMGMISKMILDLRLIILRKLIRDFQLALFFHVFGFIFFSVCICFLLILLLCLLLIDCSFVPCSGVEKKAKSVRFAELVESEVINAREGDKRKSRNAEAWAANSFDE